MKHLSKFLARAAICLIAGSTARGADAAVALPEPFTGIPKLIHMEPVAAPLPVKLASGATATTVVLQKTEWTLKDMPQSKAASTQMEREAAELTEEERIKVMNRADDFIQLWLVNMQQHPGADGSWVNSFTAEKNSHQNHRELIFLGRGKGHAWYGWMPIYQWTHLQSNLRLEGGEDPLAGAARGLLIEDHHTTTANSAMALLIEAGKAALPHIKPLVDSSMPAQSAINVLARIPGPEPGAMLLKLAASSDKQTAGHARSLLLTFPRSEAEAAYFSWLLEDLGRVSVHSLLLACSQVNKEKLAPILPRIMDAPKTATDYRLAFELSRSLAGRKIPGELINAEKAIQTHGFKNGENFDAQKVDAATQVLIRSKDVDAAACIGISLAVATTKGDWSAANKAGLKVLAELPGQHGQKLAKKVATSSMYEWERDELSQVATGSQ